MSNKIPEYPNKRKLVEVDALDVLAGISSVPNIDPNELSITLRRQMYNFETDEDVIDYKRKCEENLKNEGFGKNTHIKLTRICDVCSKEIALKSKDTCRQCIVCSALYDECNDCKKGSTKLLMKINGYFVGRCPDGFGCNDPSTEIIRRKFTVRKEAPF